MVENTMKGGKSLKAIKEDRGKQKDIDKEETTWRTNVVTDKREEKQTGERRKNVGKTR